MRADPINDSRLLWFVITLAVLMLAYLMASAARSAFTTVVCDDYEHPGVVICVDGRTGEIQP
jgi:hypothetical protein